MESAFGVDHGEVSKAMSRNKKTAFENTVKNPDLSTTQGVSRYFYASDKLTAKNKGKLARTSPASDANPVYRSSGKRLASQGQVAATKAKRFERSITGIRRYTRSLP
jgi:hypothetical protein